MCTDAEMSGGFSRLHKCCSQIVDWATCEAINALHARAWRETTTLEEAQEMLARLSGIEPQEFYRAHAAVVKYEPAQGPRRLEAVTAHPSGVAENDRLVFDFFPADSKWERPLMFLLHGLMSVSDAGYRMWARRMNGRGWHVVFVHLPYHYSRTPRGFWSGELALGPNGKRNIEALRQAVCDVRSLARWAEQRGVLRWGVLGMSYGGWVGGLLATLEQSAGPFFLIEPPVDFCHATWESPASRALRRMLEGRGLRREIVRDLDRLVSLVEMQPCCAPRAVTLFSGEYDSICPPSSIHALARKWGCEHCCFPQGHVGYRLMREAFALWSRRHSVCFLV
jgi:pimeloyl-ACP methyl ester carboxylesterase